MTQLSKELVCFPNKKIRNSGNWRAPKKLIFTNTDAYETYMINCYKNNKPVEFTSKEYKEFTSFFNKYIIDKLLLTGRIYELPNKLGRMMVLKKKSNSSIPDWQHWKQTGELKLIRNEHTQGYKTAIYHLIPEDKPLDYTQDPKIIYNPTRYSSRRTAKIIKDNPDLINKYQHYDDYRMLLSTYSRKERLDVYKPRKDYLKIIPQ